MWYSCWKLCNRSSSSPTTRENDVYSPSVVDSTCLASQPIQHEQKIMIAKPSSPPPPSSSSALLPVAASTIWIWHNHEKIERAKHRDHLWHCCKTFKRQGPFSPSQSGLSRPCLPLVSCSSSWKEYQLETGKKLNRPCFFLIFSHPHMMFHHVSSGIQPSYPLAPWGEHGSPCRIHGPDEECHKAQCPSVIAF